ncbi:hypothetical protein GCM10010392_65150 [Streptomyces clavifer]|nr:hypothetical protein GCM10010392_65150 [Streptomyces clavifer]
MEAQREDVLRARRGHEPLVAPGTGAATVLHLRKLATMDLLGQLFGVSAVIICRANQEICLLLEAHGPRLGASTARFRTPADITTFLASDLPL